MQEGHLLPPLAPRNTSGATCAAIEEKRREWRGDIQHVDRQPGPGCPTGALVPALLLLPAEAAAWWLEAARHDMVWRQAASTAARHATLAPSVCRELPLMNDDDDDGE